MNVLIVEDEPMARKHLERLVGEHFPDLKIVGRAGTVRDTLAWLRSPSNRADIVFMDVELSDGTCFDIFRQTSIEARVIMTTAYDNYAVKAFEVNCIDYLLKPVEASALRRAVERCRTLGGGVDTARLLAALDQGREHRQRYVVRFNDRIVPVNVENIAYFYAEEKMTYLVTADGNRYVMDLTLEQLSEELDTQRFFRISRGCIVALPAIASVVKHQGTRLRIVAQPRPDFDMVVSRSRVDDFLKWLEGSR